jgi:hypothetical protein
MSHDGHNSAQYLITIQKLPRLIVVRMLTYNLLFRLIFIETIALQPHIAIQTRFLFNARVSLTSHASTLIF